MNAFHDDKPWYVCRRRSSKGVFLTGLTFDIERFQSVTNHPTVSDLRATVLHHAGWLRCLAGDDLVTGFSHSEK